MQAISQLLSLCWYAVSLQVTSSQMFTHTQAAFFDVVWLQTDAGPDTALDFLSSGQGGSLARTYLTETYLRRLSRLPLNDEEDLDIAD